MTPTQKGRRSDALYFDHGHYGRRTLCDRVAQLESDLEERRARPVVTSDADTDGATGACTCGACGDAIDPWDRFCRHCGAEMEVEG